MRRALHIFCVGILTLCLSIDSAIAGKLLRRRECRPRKCHVVSCAPLSYGSYGSCGTCSTNCCVPSDGSSHAVIEATPETSVIAPQAALIPAQEPVAPITDPVPVPSVVPLEPASPVVATEPTSVLEKSDSQVSKASAEEEMPPEKAVTPEPLPEQPDDASPVPPVDSQPEETVEEEMPEEEMLEEEPAQTISPPEEKTEKNVFDEDEPSAQESSESESEMNEPSEPTESDSVPQEDAAEEASADSQTQPDEEMPAEPADDESGFDDTEMPDEDSPDEPAAVPALPEEAEEEMQDEPAASSEEDAATEDESVNASQFNSGIVLGGNQPVRRWIDNTGRHETIGRLVEVHGSSVRLLKSNGRYTTVPVERLSPHDQRYVEAIDTQIVATTSPLDTAGL